MEPLIPDAVMLAGMWPGASSANTACIMLPITEMGSQLVSPNTRSDTNISGTDSTIAASVCQAAIPRLTFCTITSATDKTTRPPATHDMGRSPESTGASPTAR